MALMKDMAMHTDFNRPQPHFIPNRRPIQPVWASTIATLALVLFCSTAGAAGNEATASAPATNEAEVSWNRDVAPLVHEHCARCHRSGEIAPMSLVSYEEARPWARAIRREVAARAMPPWHADSSQVAYANDRSLEQEAIDTIVRWVDQGAPEGATAKPDEPQFPEGWQLGEPDQIFTARKSFTVPVTDEEIPYQSVTFEIDIKEDLYLEAWEIRPSDLRVVHHANLVRTPMSLEGQSVGISSAVMKGGDYIGSYLPGHSWVTYPEGLAYKLPAGSQLGIQVHYVSVGEQVEDILQFGVHLANGRIDKLVRVVGTDYRDINIPPGEANYRIVDEIEMLTDLEALTAGAHMHLRGSAFKMEAVRPNGEVELIAWVPEYNFGWQSNYELAKRVSMPKGTKLRVMSAWDNSAANPLNPDPSQRVTYGPWTNDEMINSWSHVVLTHEKLGLKVANGRIVGSFPDGEPSQQPFLIQSLPAAPSFQKNRNKFESHDRKDGESDSDGSDSPSDGSLSASLNGSP